MAQYTRGLAPEALKEKVIVITGGANGIGAAFVEYACNNGAYVCFGDLALEAGEALAKNVNVIATSTSPPRAVFVQTDVTNYTSVLQLFDTAIKTYGCVDHAVAGAGVVEIGNIFDPALDMESIRQAPTTKVIDINLTGSIYVVRVAAVYLRQNRQNRPAGTPSDRSIILISSVAGFKGSSGIPTYQASKHGVLGLMRSLCLYLPAPAHGIRINTICPSMTLTAMVKGIQDAWDKAALPVNTPLHVGKVIAAVLGDTTLNGTVMCVDGGRTWEIQKNLDRLENQWLGEELSESLAKGQAALGSGMDWTKQ